MDVVIVTVITLTGCDGGWRGFHEDEGFMAQDLGLEPAQERGRESQNHSITEVGKEL